jgi:hypothetical protein
MVEPETMEALVTQLVATFHLSTPTLPTGRFPLAAWFVPPPPVDTLLYPLQVRPAMWERLLGDLKDEEVYVNRLATVTKEVAPVSRDVRPLLRAGNSSWCLVHDVTGGTRPLLIREDVMLTVPRILRLNQTLVGIPASCGVFLHGGHADGGSDDDALLTRPSTACGARPPVICFNDGHIGQEADLRCVDTSSLWHDQPAVWLFGAAACTTSLDDLLNVRTALPPSLPRAGLDLQGGPDLALCWTGQLSRLQLPSVVEHVLVPRGSRVAVFMVMDSDPTVTFVKVQTGSGVRASQWSNATERQVQSAVADLWGRDDVTVVLYRQDRLPLVTSQAYLLNDRIPHAEIVHIRQYDGLARCYDAIRARELEQGYDFRGVIKVRDDSHFVAPLPPSMDPDESGAPLRTLDCYSWTGINDGVYSVGRTYARKLLQGSLRLTILRQNIWVNFVAEKLLERVIHTFSIPVQLVHPCELPYVSIRDSVDDGPCVKRTQWILRRFADVRAAGDAGAVVNETEAEFAERNEMIELPRNMCQVCTARWMTEAALAMEPCAVAVRPSSTYLQAEHALHRTHEDQ